jgi:glycosyltransferase involved in cell wall biosynthesis
LYVLSEITYLSAGFDNFAVAIPPMEPKVTVVIPAYNASRYITACVSSVIEQTFTDWEAIVINDGSKDNTAEIVTGMLSDKRIKLINQKNSGVSAARNAGIKAATGKFIAFLDADDCFIENNLQSKYDVLNNNDTFDFAYSDIWKCDDNLNNLYVEKGVPVENLFLEVMQWNNETMPGFSSNVMVRASSIRDKFLFDINLSNCADRYMKILLSKNLKGAYIPEPLSKYRDTPGAMSKNVGLLQHDEEYIISKIKQDNILPAGTFRRKVIANIYFMLSGSWHKNAHKPLPAIKYGIKSILTYPPNILRLLGKTGKQLLP